MIQGGVGWGEKRRERHKLAIVIKSMKLILNVHWNSQYKLAARLCEKEFTSYLSTIRKLNYYLCQKYVFMTSLFTVMLQSLTVTSVHFQFISKYFFPWHGSWFIFGDLILWFIITIPGVISIYPVCIICGLIFNLLSFVHFSNCWWLLLNVAFICSVIIKITVQWAMSGPLLAYL